MSGKIQFYRAPIYSKTSGQAVDLEFVYRYITTDHRAEQHTAALRDLVERVRLGKAEPRAVAEYKAGKLDYVRFSGTFREPTDTGLFAHSELMCLDLDHVGSTAEVEALRQKLIADPCIETRLLFISPSGDGLKWVVAIDPQRHSQQVWYWAIAAYVKATYQVEADTTCCNVSRACFLCHDASCYLAPSLPHPAKQPFNPEAWAARCKAVGPSTPAPAQRNTSTQGQSAIGTAAPTQAAADSPQEAIRFYADYCVANHIDLTAGYKNWLSLGFALSDIFNEEGRHIFHDLSRQNDQYNPKECDAQYTKCLSGKRSGVTYRTFFALAEKAGVDLKMYPKSHPKLEGFAPVTAEMAGGVCAKNAKVPYIPLNRKIEKNTIFPFLQEEKDKGTMAQLAQTPAKTFTDKISRTDWPNFCIGILDSQSDQSDKDKMILGSLNLISGVLPGSLYSVYDRRKIYSPLYNILYGGFATKKGDLEACKQLITPIKQEMDRNYKAEEKRYEAEVTEWENMPKATRGKAPEAPVRCSPFVPANSSASAVFRALEANGGWGIMCETEADSLTNMLSKSEYGDYSDLLRKAHHHEACPMVRVSEKLYIELESPRLSVLLTCTGSQLPILLPASNVANGLASRFLFYALPDSKVEFRNVFEGNDKPIEETYRELGLQVKALYHALLDRKDHPLQFMLTTAQQQSFICTFNEMLQEQYAMMGEGIQGYIVRLALECYRYTMVLTVLRRLSERYGTNQPLFDEEEQALLCDERDFRIATTIIECLVNHTARVFAVIGNHDDDPFAKAPQQPAADLKNYFTALPDEELFKTTEAMEVAKSLNIPERTAKRMLGDLVTKYLVLDHPKHGLYQKIRKEAQDE